MTEKQVNALACALAALRHEDGGYSPDERSAAVAEIQAMYDAGLKSVLAAMEFGK